MADTSVNGIFYNAIDLQKDKKLQQIGGDNIDAVNQAEEDYDYTDGLSIFEMQNIDSNTDGVLTFEEFHEAVGDGSIQYWNVYSEVFNSMELDFSNDASYETTNERFSATGKDITGIFDEDGKLESYDISTQYNNKDMTIKQTVGNNGEVSNTKIIDNATGLQPGAGTTLKKGKLKAEITEENDKTKTITGNKDSAAGETNIKINKDGKPSEIKNDKGNFNLSDMQYTDGKLTSITIDGETYDSSNIKTNSKGDTVITKNDGTKVKIKAPDKEGCTKIYNYDANGKKTDMLNLNKDGEPRYYMEYDENGKCATKYMADDDRVRVYTHGSDGHVSSSTDYRYTDGEKGNALSEQNYEYDETLGKSVWKDRIKYTGENDEDGNPIVKQKIIYDRTDGENGERICNVSYQDAEGNEIEGKGKIYTEGKDTPKRLKEKTNVNGDTSTTIKYDPLTGEESEKTEVIKNDDGSTTTKTYEWSGGDWEEKTAIHENGNQTSTIINDPKEGQTRTDETTDKDGNKVIRTYVYKDGDWVPETRTTVNGDTSTTYNYDPETGKITTAIREQTDNDGTKRIRNYEEIDGEWKVKSSVVIKGNTTTTTSYNPETGEKTEKTVEMKDNDGKLTTKIYKYTDGNWVLKTITQDV